MSNMIKYTSKIVRDVIFSESQKKKVDMGPDHDVIMLVLLSYCKFVRSRYRNDTLHRRAHIGIQNAMRLWR